MRRMVYLDKHEDAPGEVWLQWSVAEDGSDPVLEDDFLSEPDLDHKPIRYIRFTGPQHKIEGLKEDLRSAVEVAWNRGATQWVKMNYPRDAERLEEG